MVWLQERRARIAQRVEHVSFIECTPRYPIKRKIQEPLKDVATVVWVYDGPEYHGWPLKRRRLLAAIVPHNTAKWDGPSAEKDLAEDYSRRFHRTLAVCGAALKVAPKEESDDYIKYLGSV